MFKRKHFSQATTCSTCHITHNWISVNSSTSKITSLSVHLPSKSAYYPALKKPIKDTLYIIGIQIPGTKSPRELNFVWWDLIFGGPQHGTCFVSLSLFQYLEFWGNSYTFGKLTQLCSIPVVSEVCSSDLKRSATCSQWIRGYISVMATLKFTYYFN